MTDVEQMAHHLFEGLDPRSETGSAATPSSSSARTSAAAPRGSTCRRRCARRGSASSSAPSFARIFYRNCINLGLPAVVSEAAVAAAGDGSAVELDLEDGSVLVDGERFALNPVPPFMREIFAAGGLIPWVLMQR